MQPSHSPQLSSTERLNLLNQVGTQPSTEGTISLTNPLCPKGFISLSRISSGLGGWFLESLTHGTRLSFLVTADGTTTQVNTVAKGLNVEAQIDRILKSLPKATPLPDMELRQRLRASERSPEMASRFRKILTEDAPTSAPSSAELEEMQQIVSSITLHAFEHRSGYRVEFANLPPYLSVRDTHYVCGKNVAAQMFLTQQSSGEAHTLSLTFFRIKELESDECLEPKSLHLRLVTDTLVHEQTHDSGGTILFRDLRVGPQFHATFEASRVRERQLSEQEQSAVFDGRMKEIAAMHKDHPVVLLAHGDEAIVSERVREFPLAFRIAAFSEKADGEIYSGLVVHDGAKFILNTSQADELRQAIVQTREAELVGHSLRSKAAWGMRAILSALPEMEAGMPILDDVAMQQMGEVVDAFQSIADERQLARALNQSPAIDPPPELRAKLQALCAKEFIAQPGIILDHKDSELEIRMVAGPMADSVGRLHAVIDAFVRVGNRLVALDMDAFHLELVPSRDPKATSLIETTDEYGQARAVELVPGDRYSIRLIEI